MALHICIRGHLTGTRSCERGLCGLKSGVLGRSDNTRKIQGPHPGRTLDKKTKRAITQRLRDLGHGPVADLGKAWSAA